MQKECAALFMNQLWKVSIEMTNEITIGTIYQKSNVFPGREVGRAEFDSITLDYGHALPDQNVFIRCVETGKTYEIDWSELISLAIAAGIGDEDE